MTRKRYWPSDIGAGWRERLRQRKRAASEEASKSFFAKLCAFFAAAFAAMIFGAHQ